MNSLELAENLNTQHTLIIADIRKLLKGLNCLSNDIIKTTRFDKLNREQPLYKFTEKGLAEFTLYRKGRRKYFDNKGVTFL